MPDIAIQEDNPMRYLRALSLAGLAAILAASPAAAADNYQVKNAAGTNISIRAKEIGSAGSGLYAPLFVPSDAAGNPIGGSTAPFFVTLSGSSTVSISNFPGTQAVTGSVAITNLPATQPVSGTVTVSNLPATQPVSGTVGVSNFPATQPISATALPLPTGAATAANQPVLTAAGTPSSTLITVQGSPTGTPQPVDTIIRSLSVDRGGTITAGGTAQQFMPANASRRGFLVQNQSSGDIYFNCLTTATVSQTSLRVPAGALYESSPHHAGTGACSIIGATTGQAFYAREF